MTDPRRTAESPIVSEPGSAAGDEARRRSDTFVALFKAESSYVWKTLKRLGVPERDLADIAHDVFMTVHRRFDDYDASRPVRPWLFGISYRTAARYRELARHSREVMDDAVEAIDERPAADEQLAAHQARQLLERALEGLDLDQRAAFVMHDVDGFSVPEIATALGAPLNTIYSRLRLARERVKARVARLKLREGDA